MGVVMKGSLAKENPEPKNPEIKKPSELDSIVRSIVKDKGARVIYTANNIPPVGRIPTGVFEFDLATGGGFPEGRLSIVYGPESSGKSNLAFKAGVAIQKRSQYNKVVLFDLEGTADPKWLTAIGLDIDELVICRPGYGEEAADLIQAVVHAEDVGLIIIDSIAMMTATKEIEQSMEKFDVGTASLLIKRLTNKLAHAFAEESRRDHFPAVIFINQRRYKIGVMFGDPETMSGGEAMKFLASLTIRLYGKNKMINSIHPSLPIFKETKAVIKKAKIGVCQIEFEYDMCMYPHGELRVGETDSFKTVLDNLKVMGAVEQVKGGWRYGTEVFPTQALMKTRYIEDLPFRLGMQAIVTESLSSKQFLVEYKSVKPLPKED